jgi:membrane protein DedA with SNARE-associated domain
MLKTELLPSVLLIIMGSLDCFTTVIGITFAGAKELNPFMAGIVNSNIGAFLAIKIVATFIVAFSYIVARQVISTADKKTKIFQYSSKLIKIVYVGLLAFLVLVVVNNLLILL